MSKSYLHVLPSDVKNVLTIGIFCFQCIFEIRVVQTPDTNISKTNQFLICKVNPSYS